jgi:hypothetical protein
MIRDGRQRHDEILEVPVSGRVIRVKVCSPVFFDPEGKRLHG